MIRLVGGPESNRWPKTMAIYDENAEIMNEIWSLVYDVIGEATDLYLTEEPRCEKNQNEEKTEDVHFKHLYNESELPKSKIDLVKELIKTSGLKTASDTLGGIDSLVKIAFDGDIMKYYEEMGFKPIRITDDGMNMYIDELIVNTFGLEPKGSGVFKNEINLGDFTWKSGGMNYRFTASLMPRVDSKTGQKSWRVVGISGDSGFGYGFITQRNTIGKRGRAQIFKQIIDKYNLGQFL
jgi:hypothetical protein